jgi:hypothetical protein
MNDLVSEYQQYQDATAEGEFYICFIYVWLMCLIYIVEEGEGGEGEEEEHA